MGTARGIILFARDDIASEMKHELAAEEPGWSKALDRSLPPCRREICICDIVKLNWPVEMKYYFVCPPKTFPLFCLELKNTGRERCAIRGHV